MMNHWMQRAIEVAQQGAATTTPNPRVGCVILGKEGQLLTEAFHHKAGEPHAEALALAQIGEAARGSTAYITLEPCSHTGRTPPCADALIKAGVATVVVAMRDPDPRVAGRGIERLRAAGITVHEGIETEAAANINAGFISRLVRQRPWIRLKAAVSLDGRLALANGSSQWLSDETAREDVHRWRSQACAVLTGSGTVQHDNPKMTTRLPEGVARQPVRIVLDSTGKLDPHYTIWNIQEATTIRCIATDAIAPTPLPTGVETWKLPRNKATGKLSLEALWAECHARQLHEIHLEAGGTLLTQLLREGWVDECLLYFAPRFLGDDSRPLIHTLGFEQLSESPEWTWHSAVRIGNTLRARLFKHSPYQLWQTWQASQA